ncbi:MAG: hypothetical protein ACTSRB_09335 [Candidatus Helarchaeota archaeon]
MKIKKIEVIIVSLILMILAIVSLPTFSSPVMAWNNGDANDRYFDVRFGSHDWLAHKAMNFLDSSNRTWYVDEYITVFLTGTEAPDNASVDLAGNLISYGDTAKHHNYYLANHSDTIENEDDASLRCQEEYDKAVNALNAGNLYSAAFYAGSMTHYLADLGVWGHVMGVASPHGSETHHSDFEGSAQTRMDDPAETYFSISFDGVYNSTISAYQASYEMGLDTDSNGTDGTNPGEQFDCEWLDNNYHAFTVPVDDNFERRVQDIINTCVNYLADLLFQLFNDSVNFPVIYLVNDLVGSHNQDTTVTVNVTDGDGISNVTLGWTLSSDYSGIQNITMNPSSGYYTADIPGQTAGTTVYFIVYANDTNNLFGIRKFEYTVGGEIINAPTLDAISPNPDNDGSINLNWNDVENATIYYIFRDTSPITSIVGKNAIVEVTQSEHVDVVSNTGTYYYVIIAGNSTYNSSISNCESVVVIISGGTPNIPGFELFCVIGAVIFLGALTWRRKRDPSF